MATAVEVDIQATTETSSPQKTMPARFQSCRHCFIFGSRGFLGVETRRISDHNRKMDIPVRRFVGQAVPDSPSVNDCRNDVSLIERLHSNKEARRAHRTHTSILNGRCTTNFYAMMVSRDDGMESSLAVM